jgi:hypothetical protein
VGFGMLESTAEEIMGIRRRMVTTMEGILEVIMTGMEETEEEGMEGLGEQSRECGGDLRNHVSVA